MRTTECAIKGSTDLFAALRAINALYSKILHCYMIDRFIKGINSNELKQSYQKKFGISARHFNSIQNQAEAIYKSWQELKKLRVQELSASIEATKKSLSKIEKSIQTNTSDIKKICNHQAKVLLWRNSTRQKKKPKMPKTLLKKNKALLKQEIKASKHKYHQKKRRLAILDHKLQTLQKRSFKICFGSSKLQNHQHHLQESGYLSHGEWLADWQFQRNKQSFWIGSHDEKNRNNNAQIDLHSKTISLKVPYCLEEKYGKRIVLEGIEFSYLAEELKAAYAFEAKTFSQGKVRTTHKPLSYRILERQPGKFYLQACFEPASPKLSTSLKWGSIGIDLNADHLAVVEVDRFGNFKSARSLFFDFRNKSTSQIEAILGDHIACVVDLALATGKSIIFEKLNFSEKKAGLREKAGPAYAHMLSSFAYAKYQSLLQSRCQKMRVGCTAINPAFSSVIGFIKYASYKKLSSHEKAAFIIARRGMGLSERFRSSNGTRKGTVSILACDASDVFSKKRVRHVWTVWRYYTAKIRALMSEHRRLERRVFYDPARPSGCMHALRLCSDQKASIQSFVYFLQRYQLRKAQASREAGCWLPVPQS